MATQTMAAADAALKVGYGKLHEQLNDDVILLKNIEKTSDHLTAGTQEIQFDINTKRNRGIGARDEMEDLPAPGFQKYARAKLFLKNQYGSISVSGQTFEQADGDKKSFVNIVDREVSRMYPDLALDLNRQAYGDGTGKLATLTGGSTTTTLTVDSVHWLQEDDRIDVVDFSALPTITYLYQNLTIGTINDVTNQITVSSAVTFAASDFIVRAGNYDGREWDGLQSMIGTGPYADIDPANASVWKSYVRTGVGDIEQIDILLAIQAAAKRGGKPTRIFTDYASFNAYWDLFSDQRRFTNDSPDKGGQNVDMAFKAGALGSIPITPDFNAPPGTMLFVNEGELVLNRVHDFQWMNRDGNMWARIPSANGPGYKDGYVATMYQYSNLGTYSRRGHAMLTGINPLT